MSLQVVEVPYERAIRLMAINDPVVAVDEQPFGQCGGIVIGLNEAAVPAGLLWIEPSRILREHPGPEDIDLPTPRRARIDAHAGEGLVALPRSCGSAWRREGRISRRGRSPIHPIESDPLAGDDPIAAEGLSDMPVELQSPTATGSTLVDIAVRDRIQRIPEIAIRQGGGLNPGQFGPRVVIAQAEVVRIDNTCSPASDERGTSDIVINQKAGVEGGASFLAERQVQFELTHPEIHQIIVVAEPDKPLEVIELDKGRFQVTIAGPGVEPGTAELGGEHDAERDIPGQDAEAQDIQAGKAKAPTGRRGVSGGEATRVFPLVPYSGPEGDGPIAFRQAFIGRQFLVGPELVAMIAKKVAEVV